MHIFKNIIFSFILFFYMGGQQAFAQNTSQIFGKVIDPEGNGISGITLVVADNERARTGRDGSFILPEAITLPITLSFRAVGYKTIAVSVDKLNWNPKTGLVVQLFPSSVEVAEVLVTGRRNNSYLIHSTELGGKFSGPIKDLPQSISLVSREFMEDKQAFVITDMVQDLAGVNQVSAYDDLTIRGFNSGYTSGFRLINGLRSGYGYGTSFWRTPLTANLESIEVLKGPGASLFGDITPGGTINLVTKKPLDKKHTSVNFAVGSFQTYRSALDIGGPLDSAKRILYRLNVAYENSRTFRDVNRRKNLLIAPSFTFKPADGTTVDIDLTYDNFDGYLDRGLGIRNNDFYAQARSFNVSQPTDFFKTNFLTFSARLHQQLTQKLSFHMNYMKSIYKEDLNEFRTLNTYANPPHNTVMNMRFQSKQITDYTDNLVSYLRYGIDKTNYQHQLVIGVDYSQYRGDKDNILRESRSRMLNGEAVPLTIDLENPNREIIDISSYIWRPQAEFPFLNPYKSFGFYIQDQLTVGERLHVVLGLRHEYYRSSSADLKESFETKQNAWLPRLGLTYKLNKQINYFASYSQGYVPVGADFIYNYQNYGAAEPFNPERSFQVETGFKSGFFNNNLQTEFSLFHIGRENMLIATGGVSDTGHPIYRQSGQVVSRGVEVDFRGQINKEFQVMANYSFNHTEVKTSALAGEQGLPLSNAPKNMAGMWLKYIFSKYAVKGLGFGAGVYYVDERRMDNAARKDENGNGIWDMWPAYTTINTAVYYHIKGMRLTANINNILDKYYYLGGFDYTRGFVGTPRNFMLSVGFNI